MRNLLFYLAIVFVANAKIEPCDMPLVWHYEVSQKIPKGVDPYFIPIGQEYSETFKDQNECEKKAKADPRSFLDTRPNAKSCYSVCPAHPKNDN